MLLLPLAFVFWVESCLNGPHADWHPSIEALFVPTLIMMGTPLYCTPSSPTYATLSLPCSVLDPIHFHLVSLIPNTSIPHPTISWPLALFVLPPPWSLRSRNRWWSISWGLLWGLSAFRFPASFGRGASLRPQQQHVRFELYRRCIRLVTCVSLHGAGLLTLRPTLNCGTGDHFLSGFNPSTCSARVTLPGVQDCSQNSYRCRWDQVGELLLYLCKSDDWFWLFAIMLEPREKWSLMLGDLQFSFCKSTITNYFTSWKKLPAQQKTIIVQLKNSLVIDFDHQFPA